LNSVVGAHNCELSYLNDRRRNVEPVRAKARDKGQG